VKQMDYLTLIAQQKQDKLALIEDEEEYTYGRLAQEARRRQGETREDDITVLVAELVRS